MANIPDRIADTGTAGVAAVAATSWVVTLNEYLQVVATLVAIIAGLASAVYYIKRTRNMKE